MPIGGVTITNCQSTTGTEAGVKENSIFASDADSDSLSWGYKTTDHRGEDAEDYSIMEKVID